MKFLWKKLFVSSFVTVLALFAVSLMGIAPVGAADHGSWSRSVRDAMCRLSLTEMSVLMHK